MLMTLDKCDKPLRLVLILNLWKNLKPVNSREFDLTWSCWRTVWAVMWGWTKPPPFEISLLDSLAPLFLLKSKKPKHEAHDDRSQFELSTWCSFGKKKLSLNFATSNNVSLTSRGHWTLVVGPQTTFLHSESFIVRSGCGFQGRIQGMFHALRNTVKFSGSFLFLPIAGVRKGAAVHKTNKFC